MEKVFDLEMIITLIAVIVAIISARYAINLRKYFKEFVDVSKRASNNEMHARVHMHANGDMGEFARNYNKMLKDKYKTFEEVEYKNMQLRSILKSISHGIIAIDVEGNILLINNEAKRIIECPNDVKVEGRNINFAVKNEKILKQIIKFMGSKEHKKKEIKLEGYRFCSIKLDPVYLQNNKSIIIGSIVNIEDITERVRLENMRSDFVANVSHELKTPLTSISGFAETLKMNEDMDPETRKRFLDIIDGEANRLRRLINDILTLSFIENAEQSSNEEVVNIYDVYKRVEAMVKNNADTKNISIFCECSSDDISISANRDYIKQIMLNLVDNAVKYTPSDGKVNVSIFKDGGNIVIKIKDNGMGIPEEDIDRIFERFYRVDKARSREIGGTGLGLAIVKHIVIQLQGTINVESKVNEGSTFTVKLPIERKL